MTSKNKLQALLQHRFSPVLLATLLLCSVSLITRVVLLINSKQYVDWSILNLLGIFLIGLLYDLAAASFAVIPLVLYVWLMPDKWYRTKVNKVLLSIYFLVVIGTLLFNGVSEWFFWEEFSVRYNFIAVDYLVYTTEVIGNIRQSYPVNTILVCLLLISVGILFLFRKYIWLQNEQPYRFKKRTLIALVLLCIPVAVYALFNHKWKYFSPNQYVSELAGNGMYDFGNAFWNNELDYDTFYKTLPIDKAEALIRKQLNSDSTNAADKFTLRQVNNPGEEKRMNVVLISVESLSADFMTHFGNTQHITPQLDSLAKQGLLFTNLYASGTRTVRGLEALALSIPPTPGQSIVKRPDNKGLFSLGSILKSKGYHSRYVYGGYGYFDNMNAFFSANGYDVTDRSALKDSEIHYSNIWGVADEDLFTLSLRLGDEDYNNKKNFFAHVMTVSNHRPYTYPEGRIDIPSHTGREGAVKYTDYAIGRFIKEASVKPWFKNTIFIIVADHCASSAGEVELPVNKYHIPMIIYSPGNIAPGNFDKLTAQIDIPPTLLGLLNMDYTSKFFGQDVFKMKPGQERAFISTYQSLGYLKNNKLVILDPNRKTKTFIPDFVTGNSTQTEPDNALIDEAISNYQVASYMYRNHLYNSK
ncbi:LTA synthase family protein [Pedobacter hiemivivus]|uniref:LTA synthase family protein n=1 Tax=Pedobacter hiemivivus TaxID=2530454 RepID=A0A4U1G8Y1_9SPHI|nr:LTA synthase family protein [Pedobacter hiemivivus]TKC59974.1 LTA synthase family protein [Pedobacter hiemivivus]